MNLFDSYKIKNHIRLIELFGGIGSQAMALRDIGADFIHWRLVEFCKYAVASYNAIHGTNFEPTDIKNVKGEDLGIVDTQNFTYILTYSFPCQDLSLAGKQRGMTKGSGTRSCLLWEVERLLNETENLPQVLLMENVPQVHGTKNINDFNLWIDFLKSKGYSNFWQDLNAKDYGVAQNRKRCFMVSILGNEFYEFPQPVKLNKCIKDYLEDEVDEKYYIKSEKAFKLILDLQERGILESAPSTACLMNLNKVEKVDNDVPKTLCARDYKGFGTGFDVQNGVIEWQKDNLLLEEKPECINLYDEQGKETSFQDRVYKTDKISPTITTSFRPNYEIEKYRIRKLTPKECWRLMGFSDEDFEKAAKVNSNTQLYKQAGNSIVKDVLMAIFRQMIG